MNEFMGRSKIAGDCVFNAKTIFVIESAQCDFTKTIFFKATKLITCERSRDDGVPCRQGSNHNDWEATLPS